MFEKYKKNIRENERLRAENEFLKAQNKQLQSYRDKMEKEWTNWWRYDGSEQREENEDEQN